MARAVTKHELDSKAVTLNEYASNWQQKFSNENSLRDFGEWQVNEKYISRRLMMMVSYIANAYMS